MIGPVPLDLRVTGLCHLLVKLTARVVAEWQVAHTLSVRSRLKWHTHLFIDRAPGSFVLIERGSKLHGAMGELTNTSLVTAAGHARQLSRVFSASALVDLARRGHSPLLSSVAREAIDEATRCGMTYEGLFEYCHAQLWAYHRCEYVYKNAIANKILLGRHSVRTTRFLSEFRVEECKADVVLINGTSTCYEIKTELDGLDRLARQVQSYTRVFDRTYVVTFEGCADRIEGAVPEKVGVLVLADDYAISTRREAASNRSDVVPASIFNSLRRDEYVAILRDALGEVPDVPNTRIYTECQRLFCSLSPATAHDGMVRALKRRTVPPPVASLAETSVPSIRAALLTAPLRAKDASKLTETLPRAVIQ